ncbi:phosphotransferase family enzyme [Pacificibacter maritimus]|uniref:Phosphotransferase family enzyme n=1 Tax=Pacificibacter maritimus TaxID=762213 RepID=A0A3N4U1F9_9RHOB|nr:phosphotransferase [Pacificibacter maritimus]RPE64643.1 phosphotransferase family enzyme [Pacificibacter maritimus]
MTYDPQTTRLRNTSNDLPTGFAQAVALAGFGTAKTWRRLQGGRSNLVFVGQFYDRQIVFKIFRSERSNPLFPNDVTSEMSALTALESSGFAPRPLQLFHVHGRGCLAYEFIDGEPARSTSQAALKTLASVHQLTPPSAARRVLCDRTSVKQQGFFFLKGDETSRANYLRDTCPTVADVGEVPPSFLHGDPTPANTIHMENRVIFVDWQCPGAGDPIHDLSLALSPAMQLVYGNSNAEKVTASQLLAAYDCPTTTDRYTEFEPLLRWRIAAYCHWKAMRGETVYAAAGLAEFS